MFDLNTTITISFTVDAHASIRDKQKAAHTNSGLLIRSVKIELIKEVSKGRAGL